LYSSIEEEFFYGTSWATWRPRTLLIYAKNTGAVAGHATKGARDTCPKLKTGYANTNAVSASGSAANAPEEAPGARGVYGVALPPTIDFEVQPFLGYDVS
jgi:hypothetical protein